MKVTYCSECENVVEDTRKRLPPHWLCRMHPRLEGQGFVAPKIWAEMEPFLRCRDTNGGRCPVFIERRVTVRTPTSKPNHERQSECP